MNDRIVNSALEQDLYKWSMACCAWQHRPLATVEYALVNRGGQPLAHLYDPFMEQVEAMSEVVLSQDEANYLAAPGWIDSRFLSESVGKRMYSPGQVGCSRSLADQLSVTAKGLWLNAIWWEIVVLPVLSELYYADWMRRNGVTRAQVEHEVVRRTREKVALLRRYPQVKVANYGLRRRFAAWVEDLTVEIMATEIPTQFVGASNVHLARKYGVKPIGTMAHEYIEAHLSFVARLELAQPTALHAWLQTYKDSLGTALTDTFSTEAFFHDFDCVLARAFSSVRQDSGNPFTFARRMIDHYKSLGIDPRTKTIVFSDSLTVERAIQIWTAFAGEVQMAFGIGTNLTNDTGFVEPLSIVMKLMKCDGQDVVKISDDAGKVTGSREVAERVKAAYAEVGVRIPIGE